jgi:hypothetical protein
VFAPDSRICIPQDAFPISDVFVETTLHARPTIVSLANHHNVSYAYLLRPLKNAPFYPISASGLNFNPQNTQCIPVDNPAKAGSPSLNLKKNKHFSKVSPMAEPIPLKLLS